MHLIFRLNQYSQNYLIYHIFANFMIRRNKFNLLFYRQIVRETWVEIWTLIIVGDV